MVTHWSEFTKYKDAFDYIIESKPKFIIEYGGGYSTYYINQLLDELNYGAKVITFESEPEWLEKYNQAGYNEKGSIRFAPIEYVDKDNGYIKYRHSYEGFEEVDFVIIDGPDYRLYTTSTGQPSNATTNLKDIVELKGEEIPYFVEGRLGTVRYYEKDCKYTKRIEQLSKH